MYPLLLKPPVKDYIWGGQKLKTEYNYNCNCEKAAEAWVLSCHKDGSDEVMNGELAGKSLPEVIALWGENSIGIKAKNYTYFPLLIKLIDAKDRLSVQVHPNDEYALKNEGEYGKTEMWYVVDCEEKSELIYGFNRKISKEEFKERIRNNTLQDVCNYVPVHKGDVFFIQSGTLHAIGKGILIAEVQQNSNTTYRVSDYGRLGADGKPRQLHVKKALDVTTLQKPSLPYGAVGETVKTSFGSERQLARCNLFTTKIINLNGSMDVNKEDSFVSIVVLNGEIDVNWQNGVFKANKGSSIFVPAGLKTTFSGKAEILKSSL